MPSPGVATVVWQERGGDDHGLPEEHTGQRWLITSMLLTACSIAIGWHVQQLHVCRQMQPTLSPCGSPGPLLFCKGLLSCSPRCNRFNSSFSLALLFTDGSCRHLQLHNKHMRGFGSSSGCEPLTRRLASISAESSTTHTCPRL